MLAATVALPVHAQTYPAIPEPMVFDMVRPLGAKKGELEANTLGQINLSGRHREVEWAPEVEMALADGFAAELELPLTDRKVTAYKMGLQGTFGTLRGGDAVHGVQYLGVYDRADDRWYSSLLYLIGNRLGERWSSMTMIGIGDVTFSGPNASALLLNQSIFYDLGPDTILGIEANYRTGGDRYWLIMPQLHHDFGPVSMQAGIGATKARGSAVRPRAGLRLIAEF
ncbi:hypothetical protein EOD43_11725 [Sphingomonas crocodyli]|uniref:Uncharacterized protein n=1 Tax=Sphingomonas crocodyli TaxID=1979270 RepID=A0A437MBZ0_9SPHN|nr:hypothetical protein EOD43_11725 [Sphingomonas crocodyli]